MPSIRPGDLAIIGVAVLKRSETMRAAIRYRWVITGLWTLVAIGTASAQQGSTSGGSSGGSSNSGATGGFGGSTGTGAIGTSSQNLNNAQNAGVAAGSLLNSFPATNGRVGSTTVSTSNPFYATYWSPLAQGAAT